MRSRKASTVNLEETLSHCRGFSRPFRVTRGRKFCPRDVAPDDTLGFRAADKPRAAEALAQLQDRLYAQKRWAVLLIFQAMDAAGKDSVIKHVMSSVNPQGCQVYSFKAPNAEELNHDFLWRCGKRLPERGRIGIFNRSYYEETLIVRVHPELLARQQLPPERVTRQIWRERFQDIRHFERYLHRNGVLVRNSSCTSRKRSRNGGSSNASKTRTRTGSFPVPTWPNAGTGTRIWPLTKT